MEMQSGDGSKEDDGRLSALKDGTFGALFQIKQSIKLSVRFFCLATLVSVLQMCYMLVADELALPWPTVVSSSVAPFFRACSIGFIDFGDQLVFLVLLGAASGVTFLSVGGLVCLGHDEHFKRRNFRYMAAPLGLAIRLQQTVLQAPILVLCLRGIRCQTGADTSSVMSHGSTVHLVVAIGAGICVFLHLIMTGIFSLVMHHHLPYSAKGLDRTLFAAPHGRAEFGVTLARSASWVAFAALCSDGAVDTPPKNITQVILLVALSLCALVICGLYLYFLPFYNQTLNRFVLSAYAIYLWACAAGVVAHAVGTSDDMSPLLLFCVSGPFVVVSAQALVNNRVKWFHKKHTNKSPLSTPYLMEIRLRLEHQHLTAANSKFSFSGAAEDDYRNALGLFPQSPFLHLYVATLVTSTSNRIIFALNMVKQARQSWLPLDLDFCIYCHYKQNVANQAGSEDSASYQEVNQNLANARAAITTTLKLTAVFWRNVQRGRFTIDELLLMGAQVHREQTLSRQYLQKVSKLSRTNREVLNLYALYHHFVMNDKRTAMRILTKETATTGSAEAANAAATISGDLSNLGQVLDLSDGMCELFGYARGDVIGRNINMLCPPPFDRVHDLFLKQFVSLDAEFVPQSRRVFGLNGKGFIMALDLDITPSVNANSELVLRATFKQIPSGPDTHLLMVDARTRLVTAFTNGAPKALGIDEHDIYALNLHVTAVIPDFIGGDGEVAYMSEREVSLSRQNWKVKSRQMAYKSKSGAPADFDFSVYVVTFAVASNRAALTAENRKKKKSSSDGSGGDDDDDDDNDDEDNNNNDGDDDGSDHGDAVSSGSLDGTRDTEEFAGPSNPDTVPEVADTATAEPGKPAPPPVRPVASPGSLSSKSRGSRASRLSRSGKGASNIKNAPRLGGDGMSTGSSSRFKSGGAGGGAGAGGGPGGGGSETSSLWSASNLEIGAIHRNLAQNMEKKDPKLRVFGRFARRFAMGFAIFVIADAGVLFWYYNRFIHATLEIEHALELAHHLALISLSVLYHVNPVVDASEDHKFVRRGQQSEYKAILVDSMDAVLELHRELNAESNNVAEVMQMPDLLVRQTSGEVKNMSQHVAVFEYVSHTARFVLEDGMVCLDSCHFILNNGVRSIFSRALFVSSIFEHEALYVLDDIHNFDLVIILAACVLLSGAFLLGFLPMFADNWRRKRLVGKAFIAIPVNIAKHLQGLTEKRLKAASTYGDPNAGVKELDTGVGGEAGDDDESMIFDLLEQQNVGRPLSGLKGSSKQVAAANVKAQGTGAAITEVPPFTSRASASKISVGGGGRPSLLLGAKDGNVLTKKAAGAQSLGMKFGKSAKVAPRSQPRKISSEPCLTATWKFAKNAARIGANFWLVLGYFAIQLSMDSASKSHVVQLSAVVHTTGQRFVLVEALQFWAALEPDAKDWEHRDLTYDMVHMKELYDEVVMLDTALKYGDAALGVHTFTETVGAQFELVFHDACHAHCESYIEENPNSNQDVIDLHHGLALALDHHMERFEAIYHAELDYRAHPSNATREELQMEKARIRDLEPTMILNTVLQESLHLSIAQLDDAVHDMQKSTISGAIVIVVLLVAGHLVSMSAFSAIDRELKKNNALLLMLPIEVFKRVPDMVVLLNESTGTGTRQG